MKIRTLILSTVLASLVAGLPLLSFMAHAQVYQPASTTLYLPVVHKNYPPVAISATTTGKFTKWTVSAPPRPA